MEQIIITIARDGSARAICRDPRDVASIGTGRSRRASHVLPRSLPLRLAFRAIRLALGDWGSAAVWTRSWRCLWTVDLDPSEGPVLGPFASRAEAIDAEVEWLAERTSDVKQNN